jgi:hypothetical protein
MAAWPGEVIEERASEIAAAAGLLLQRQVGWRHRRVETLTVLSHEQVRRHVSVDFTVPEELRESLRLAGEEFVVPLALLAKRPLVHFDLRNEEGHSVPLLTAEQDTTITRELLHYLLELELAAQDVNDAAQAALDRLVEAVLADSLRDREIERLEREHGLEPLVDFRATADTFSRGFVLWAVVRGLDRRRVFKFGFDEPFAQRAGLGYAYDARGCTEAWSYHLEVAVPQDLRARSTLLVDAATDQVLAAGPRDADRPALYVSVDPAHKPARPQVAVDYGAERWRFLAPAAIVAAVIALLVGPPWLFADLQSLAGSSGPAIALVLSTSAVFSALVLRTDEHPLLRRLLVRYRICLVACTLSALFAAASLGFRADAWIVEVTWGLATVVSALAAGILIMAAVRSPSVRSTPSAGMP